MDTITARYLEEARCRHNELLTKGYDPIRAFAIATVYFRLSRGTTRLNGLTQPQDDHKEIVRVDTLNDGNRTFLSHDNVLLPPWVKFCEALSAVPPASKEDGYIELNLRNVQLKDEVSDLLLDSFKTAPLESLILSNNQLGSDGLQFVVKALAAIQTLKALSIFSNMIASEDDAASLVTAASNHVSIDALLFVNCGLGTNDAVMEAIVPVLDAIESISLKGNQIGSDGVKLIAEYLAKNPTVRVLSLNNNLINDKDAVVLAGGLKKNTNLRGLHVMRNPISSVGILGILSALVNGFNPFPRFPRGVCQGLPVSLDSVHNSNHTCWVNVGEGNNLAQFNKYVKPKTNRNIKLLSFLVSTDENYTNMRYLDDMPVEIMPRVIGFIMEHSPETRKHNDVFMLMREWSLPLLYTFKGLNESGRTR